MGENCPICRRPMERIEHYPFVYPKSFQRFPIPAGILFPNPDPVLYISGASGASAIGSSPPGDVMDFFAHNPGLREHDFGDSLWYIKASDRKNDEVVRIFLKRFEKDVSPRIMVNVAPYLDALDALFAESGCFNDDLFAEEVLIPTASILPGFSQWNNGFYHIPATAYFLMISEASDPLLDYCKANRIGIPVIDGNTRLRHAFFSITTSLPETILDNRSVTAVVALLVYKGGYF